MSRSLDEILQMGEDCRTWEIGISGFSALFCLTVLELLHPVHTRQVSFSWLLRGPVSPQLSLCLSVTLALGCKMYKRLPVA